MRAEQSYHPLVTAETIDRSPNLSILAVKAQLNFAP
jgi:hypothetical protein